VADPASISILVALAVVPPLTFLFWLRAHEKHDREPVRSVMLLFLYGGTLGVMLAILLSIVFDVGFSAPDRTFGLGAEFFAVVVGAPLMEELGKSFGFPLARRRITELEDGIVYGAAIGLGFAATENLIYGLTALSDGGTELAYQTIALRVFSSTLLHASSSALLGFGYGLMVLRRGVVFHLLPYYLVAAAQHSLYNYLVYTQDYAGFLVAVGMVVVVSAQLRHRLKVLDRQHPGAA
jgi:protease PrsW